MTQKGEGAGLDVERRIGLPDCTLFVSSLDVGGMSIVVTFSLINFV